MRLSFALLLPAMAGVAHAATPSIQGMIYWPSISVPKDGEELVLTPKQLRLVLAGQLDLSQYHALTEGSSGKTDPTTLDIINRLVDGQERLLDDESAERGRNLIIFRGNSEQIEKLKNSPNGKHNLELSYSYSVPESSVRLEDLDRLIADLKIQAAAADSTIHEFDLSEPIVKQNLHRIPYISSTLLVNTDALKKSSAPANAFGAYTMPNGASKKIKHESFRASASTHQRDEKVTKPLGKLPALCYSSLESCTSATNNCSGHGECFRKYGPAKGASGAECFACGCVASFEKNKTTYWGGAACQKEDVSSQFWILAGFSVLLMGLVGWAIGMMFSIGNEKLPGVIGAGVAPKTR